MRRRYVSEEYEWTNIYFSGYYIFSIVQLHIYSTLIHDIISLLEAKFYNWNDQTVKNISGLLLDLVG